MVDIIFWKPNDLRGILYSRAFGVADYEFDIGFPFFEMADPIWRTWIFWNSTIFAQLCTLGFSGSLITNFKLDFQNSIWRIQYGRHKNSKSVQFHQNSVLGSFWGLCLRFRHPTLSKTQRQLRGRNRILSSSRCFIRVRPLACHWNTNPLSHSSWNTDYRMVIHTLYRKLW